MSEEEKIEELETKLDEALLKVFDLESRRKSDSLLRYELEEMLRSIYHECSKLKASEKKPEVDQLLENLAENIKRLFTDYKIRL